MANDNVRKDKDDGAPRRFTFSFSTPGVVSLAVVAVAALAWAFVLGVLVGRGYKPEQAVPELARIMPDAERNATAPAPEKPEAPGVLKAEELHFYDNLNKKPGEEAATEAEAPAPKPKPAPKAEPAKAAEAAPQAPPAQAEPAPAPKAEPAQAQAESGARFAYVYQVGSLRDPEDAGRYAAKLRKLGLTTSIEAAEVGGATWHRVMVHFQGTPQETDALKDILATLGITKPIMKSKKPL